MTYPYAMPTAIREAIDEYLTSHKEQGGFVMSVLENDLKMAVGRADQSSMRYLKDIVLYCCNEIPSDCWGSKQKVEDWLACEDVQPRREHG